MKKISIFLLLFVLVVSLNGCLSAKNRKVAKLVISITDNIPGYDEMASLEFLPDYEKRTLKLNYSIDDLKVENESIVATSGEVGEENFQKFEKMLKTVSEYEGPFYSSEEKPEFFSTLKIVLENGNGKIIDEINTDWIDEAEGLEEIRTFYLDLSTMLTETEKI